MHDLAVHFLARQLASGSISTSGTSATSIFIESPPLVEVRGGANIDCSPADEPSEDDGERAGLTTVAGPRTTSAWT